MKIIIFGGNGFVGSHLCEILSKDKDNDVYSLDGGYEAWKIRNNNK